MLEPRLMVHDGVEYYKHSGAIKREAFWGEDWVPSAIKSIAQELKRTCELPPKELSIRDVIVKPDGNDGAVGVKIIWRKDGQPVENKFGDGMWANQLDDALWESPK